MKITQQLQLLDKISRELEDLKNSQTAVLKKIAQIEADNINLGVEVLSDAMPGIHEEIDDSITKVQDLIEKFQDHRSEFAREHPIPPEEMA